MAESIRVSETGESCLETFFHQEFERIMLILFDCLS